MHKGALLAVVKAERLQIQAREMAKKRIEAVVKDESLNDVEKREEVEKFQTIQQDLRDGGIFFDADVNSTNYGTYVVA